MFEKKHFKKINTCNAIFNCKLWCLYVEHTFRNVEYSTGNANKKYGRVFTMEMGMSEGSFCDIVAHIFSFTNISSREIKHKWTNENLGKRNQTRLSYSYKFNYIECTNTDQL